MNKIEFGWNEATGRREYQSLIAENKRMSRREFGDRRRLKANSGCKNSLFQRGLYQMFNDEHQQQALLTVLYSLEPEEAGDPFIEVRRWETFSGDSCELIVEIGHVDENGDLQTKCHVLPFHMNVNQALLAIGD